MKTVRFITKRKALNIAAKVSASLLGIVGVWNVFLALFLVYTYFWKGEWVGWLWQQVAIFGGKGSFFIYVAACTIRRLEGRFAWQFSLAMATLVYWELRWQLDYLMTFRTGIGAELPTPVYDSIIYGAPAAASLLIYLLLKRFLRWALHRWNGNEEQSACD